MSPSEESSDMASGTAPAPQANPPADGGPRGAADQQAEAAGSQQRATDARPSADGAAGTSPPPPAAAVNDAPPPIAPDTIHPGRVSDATPDSVLVDFGEGQRGLIPLQEFGWTAPPAGTEIHIFLEHLDPTTGLWLLSKQKADIERTWQTLTKGAVVEGRVTGMNKGGLEVDINGVRAFMPGSQADVRRMHDISTLLNEQIRCVVTKIRRDQRQLLVSRRRAIEREEAERRRRVLDKLAEGQVCRGVVRNLTEYGAFIDLGGVDGLLHITDMSYRRINTPAEVVTIGQEIDVRVLKVDRRGQKVSLGLRQLAPDPWEEAASRYPGGARVTGRVTRLLDFGAFVELPDGLEALIPVSELSWTRFRSLDDVVQIGQEIEAVVLAVDTAKKRMSLSLRQATPDPWAEAVKKFSAGNTVTGRVKKLVQFGVFVELEPGVEGLVHISEMADRRVDKPGDVVQPNQEVQVRVLRVDLEQRRIALSMRPPRPEEKPAPEAEKSAQKPKRKKPLRGGLTSHFQWW